MGKKEIARIVKEAASLRRKTLVESEAKEVLRLSGVPVPRFCVVKDAAGAVEAAKKIGYPVALKLLSPDILHKSDVGGVALGIRDAQEIERQWSQMILNVADENPSAFIEGFLIEEMAPKGGVEVIVGAINDEQFGPVVMFGAGGVAVELMKDVSFALAPLSRDEAFSMMSEVKAFPLLTGFRGAAKKDLGAIADVIDKLAAALGAGGIKEIEINPLIVYERGAIAVDARAVLG